MLPIHANFTERVAILPKESFQSLALKFHTESETITRLLKYDKVVYLMTLKLKLADFKPGCIA